MGDCVGNFHSLLTFRNEKELNIVRELVHRMVERAIRLDGTCMFEGSFILSLLS
jgi:D-lactate dehydrogenase (cytochrome)